MKGISRHIINSDPTRLDNDSDLEDGELPGEVADGHEAFVNAPRKQLKLTHGDHAGKHGRRGSDVGSKEALEPESYNHGRHGHQDRRGDSTAECSAADNRDHAQHHRRHHQERAQQHPSHPRPQKCQYQHQHHHLQAQQQHQPSSKSSSAVARKSAAFEANKAALKARLQSLESPEIERSDLKGGAGARGGGNQQRGPAASMSPHADAAAAATPGAKGRQLTGTEASPAATAGGGVVGGGGNYVADVYKEACPSVEIKGLLGGGASPHHIRLSDVQSLAMWVLSPAGNLVEAPRWAFVKNKPLVQGVVLVLASGLSSAMMKEKEHLLPFLSSLGRSAIVHTSPQARPAQTTAELLTTKVTARNAKRKRSTAEEGHRGGSQPGSHQSSGATGAGSTKAAAAAVERQLDKPRNHRDGATATAATAATTAGTLAATAGGSQPPPPPAAMQLPPGPFPPSHYVASLQELKQHNYPLPSLEGEGEEGTGEGGGGRDGAAAGSGSTCRLVCPPGFVATRPSGDPTASERMVALDCEMCVTEAGFELTRITLVAGPGWESGTAVAAAAAVATSTRRGAAAAPPRPGHGNVHRDDAANGGGGGGGRSGCSDSEEDDGQGEDDEPGGSGRSDGLRSGGGGGGSTKTGCYSGAVLLDELVVPRRPILDYNTRYSGITAQMLEGCTNRLEDVRERFLSLVPSECLLVGHALENDLAALRTCHGRVLDTAILFPHPKGPPFKSALKILARRFLRRTIQDGAHDSVVDGRTALDLALLKIKHGPSYGCGSSGPHASAPKLAEVLQTQCGVRTCLVDRHDVLSRFVTGTTAAVPVASDDDAVAMAGRQAASRTYGLVWTQLTEVAVFMFRRARQIARLEEKAAVAAAAAAEDGGGDSIKTKTATMKAKTRDVATAAAGASGRPPPAAVAVAPTTPGQAAAAAATNAATAVASSPAGDTVRGNSTPSDAAASGSDPGPGSASQLDYSDAVLDQLLVSYDNRLRRLWEALPPRYMLVVTTGAGDTAEYDRLYEQKCKRCVKNSGLPPWNLKEETALLDLGASVMQALCFAAVKGDDGGVAGSRGSRGRGEVGKTAFGNASGK